MLTLTLALLAGCDQFDVIVDQVEGLTNPMVAQTLILGVAEPDSNDVDLSGTDFDKGAVVQVFLADAASANEMENAPVSGADVGVRVGNTPSVSLTEDASGAYQATADDGFEYQAQASAVMSIDYGGSSSSASLTLPQPANVDVPETHSAGSPMDLDLSSFGFNAVIGVVIDASTGDVTWENRPEGVMDVYDMTHGDGTVDALTIPGSAFPAGCACAVGVAGMMNGDSSSFEGMNTGLSSFTAGQIKFFPVLVP